MIDHIKLALGTLTAMNDPNQVQLFTACQDPLHPTKSKHQDQERFSRIQTCSNNLLDQPVVLSNFRYKIDMYITKIQPTTDNNAWIGNCTSSKIILLDNEGKIKQEIQKHFLLIIQDISVSPKTGHLWFCCMYQKCINEVISLSETTEPVTRFETEARPQHLCMTKDDHVVVGTDDKRITVYTSNGEVLHTTSQESCDITSCLITGNMAILSREPVNRQYIIVYDRKLNSLFQYRGEGISSVAPGNFGPESVTYDSRGMLVIADWARNTIELISGTGQYIRTLHTNGGGQGYVGIQNDDVLWTNIESETGEWEIKLLKYYKD